MLDYVINPAGLLDLTLVIDHEIPPHMVFVTTPQPDEVHISVCAHVDPAVLAVLAPEVRAVITQSLSAPAAGNDG